MCNLLIFRCSQLIKKKLFVWTRPPPYLSFWLLNGKIWFRIYSVFFSIFICASIHMVIQQMANVYCRSHREWGLTAANGLGRLDLGLGHSLSDWQTVFSGNPRNSHTFLGNRRMFAQITWAEMLLSPLVHVGALGRCCSFPKTRVLVSNVQGTPLSDIGGPGSQVRSQGKDTDLFFFFPNKCVRKKVIQKFTKGSFILLKPCFQAEFIWFAAFLEILLWTHISLYQLPLTRTAV